MVWVLQRISTRVRYGTSTRTWSWWKMMLRFGSKPMARRTANASCRAARKTGAGGGSVSACQPTMEKMSSASGGALFCN
jgi:hypothetical protein